MARRHSSTSRNRPAAAADSDDVFVEKTLAFSGWAQQNRQTLILIGVAVAAVLVGGLYYWNYRRQHLERAAVELERVEQGAAFGDTTTAKVELAQYVESFGNTPYGNEARLLLGQISLESGQADEAVKTLASGANLDDPLGVQIAGLLARAYEQKGDPKQAEDLLLRLAAAAPLEFQVRDALEEAARLRAVQGNNAGAVELYQRILDKLEANAPERGVYELRLEELKQKGQAS